MNASKRLAGWFAGLLVLGLLAGCATGPRITAEADSSADFSAYRTFGFYAPLAMEKDGYATPTSEAIKAAARTQMEARGYVFVTENPDLWVNINTYIEERTDVYTTPTVDYGYYYSYRHGYVLVPYWTEQTNVTRFSEGTMNIDVVDAAQNRLIWEGIAVGRIPKLKPEERNAKISAAVAEIFQRFPVGPTGATP